VQGFMRAEFARALLAHGAGGRELLDDRNRHVPQPAFARCHGIDQQHGDGHGADAAGHGRNVGRLGRHAFEIDVADKPAVLEPVDTDIDYDRACAHHLRQEQLGCGAKRLTERDNFNANSA
jgi:hypothetical protein